MSRIVTPLALAATLSLGACGAARQAAATQATPAAFDAARSDPKALAIADQVLATLGGEENWKKPHEFLWFQAIIMDGKVIDAVTHSWDRWEGRHGFTRYDSTGQILISMHDLFAEGGGYAYVESKKGGHKSVSSDKLAMVKEARRRFETDAYPLFVPFKLKDPGVHLKFSEELPEEGSKQGSPMVYDVIQINFDEGVGSAPKDTWYLVVRKSDHMPTSVEHVLAGKPDTERLGFTLEKWVEVGGLKFATERKTLGYTKADAPQVPVTIPKVWLPYLPPDIAGLKMPNPGEVVIISEIKANLEATEDEYIPVVE